jgi:hypothetical protein
VAKKENITKNFVLRIDAETMDAIEKWAADEFRSTNGQLQWIIAEALKKHGRLKKSKKQQFALICKRNKMSKMKDNLSKM